MQIQDFFDKHAGRTGWVIGKGPADFDYGKLAEIPVDDPVFFINDAVTLERFLLPQQKSYMTFLDHSQRVWLHKPVRSTILCPWEHNVGWTEDNAVWIYMKDPDLSKLRKEPGTPLFVDRGTICTLISFAWLTGVSAINFIGCDGNNTFTDRPYDRRIYNHSGGQPNWEYDIIRYCQEQLCQKLQLPFRYLGTPNKTPRDI